jgi:Fur family transcriptional regulator, peroxide stress response regulator
MHSRAHPDKFQAFLNLCREHRLKMTPQRAAIFKVILDSDKHPTADAVYRAIQQDYPNISFDTVNRTLLTFAGIGVVDVVEIFGGAKRFDPNVANHHHLHCVRCGTIIDFQNRSYDNLKVPEDLRDQFQVISKRVVLRGLCKACRD